MSSKNGSLYSSYEYTCACEWRCNSKERRALDMMVRLHTKKCSRGGKNKTTEVLLMDVMTSSSSLPKVTLIQGTLNLI